MREDEARDALERAGSVENRVRRGGRWLAGYCALYGTGSIAVVLAVGLAPHGPLRTGVFAVFMVMVVVLVVWAATRPVKPRGFAWLHTGMIAGWAVLYTVALNVGLRAFPGDPAWWVPMAVATAVPPWVLAAYMLRTSGGRA
ncbi:hypothetical protein IDM40_17630 [Nocardiopsis sp. HNM0947]|uniref:Integral membrane protein n=1 Tax=Nocardiopsis coralli TaxID=2772213 RepID=A0ABR9P9J2_9ACTN|nr:hypothetical protein [Nocardiopsis coralli]MBE3000509.1 hypothetical protein [Nocardiopsis coralli]